MTNLTKIRKEFKKLNIDCEIFRSPSGYYYFIGNGQYQNIPSLPTFNLNGFTTEQVVEYVQSKKSQN